MTNSFHIYRSRDLLNVWVELFNFDFNPTASAPTLRRTGPGPAALVLRLPPQHIAEEVAVETSSPPQLPYLAFTACPTRLSFSIPDDTNAIDFQIAEVLKALGKLQPDGGAGGGPTSRLEFPAQLLLTPQQTCLLAPQQALPDGDVAWIPVWHMRLDPKQGPARFRAVRNPLDRERFSSPSVSTLTSAHRADIVTYSERHADNVIVVEDMVATSLGATVRLKSEWRDEGLQLTRWSQSSVLGRDQHVERVERGYLFPFGHRASLTTVIDRTISDARVAGLTSRGIVVIEEPERRYDGLAAGGYVNGGREMPFKMIRLAPEHGFPLGANNSIFVNATGVDWHDNAVNFSSTMFFVALSDANREQVLAGLAQRFTDAGAVTLSGQRMALAAVRGDGDAAGGDTEATVYELGFNVASPPINGPIQPPFLPYIKSARVSLPAIEQYLGNARGGLNTAAPNNVRMEFHSAYLAGGFAQAANPKQVFAKFLDQLPGLAVPAERAGGLSAPKFPPIDGLSRIAGPVAGVEGLVNNNLINVASLVGNAKLLGTIPLASLLDNVLPSADGIPLAEFAELYQKVDQLPPTTSITQPILTTVQTTAGVETRFVWKPKITSTFADDSFGPGAGGPMQLVLKGRVRQTGAHDSSFDVEGTLTNFKIHFAGLVALDFAALTFKSSAGAKMQVGVRIAGFEFEPGLNFVSSLLPLLKNAGIGSGFRIEPQPDGVQAIAGVAIPSFALGAMSLENIAVSATVSIPFVADKPAAVRIALSERSKPFLVSVAPFGGTGFFAVEVRTDKGMRVEAAIEFGGVLSINLLGIVKGGIYAFAGIYVCIGVGNSATDDLISGFVHWGGYADVLGIVSVSIEFYVALDYSPATQILAATASLRIGVKVLFFSKTFRFSVRQEVANFGSLPSSIATMSAMISSAPQPASRPFADLQQWKQYCSAFA